VAILNTGFHPSARKGKHRSKMQGNFCYNTAGLLKQRLSHKRNDKKKFSRSEILIKENPIG